MLLSDAHCLSKLVIGTMVVFANISDFFKNFLYLTIKIKYEMILVYYQNWQITTALITTKPTDDSSNHIDVSNSSSDATFF